MLQGKSIHAEGSYVIKMGGVTINVTDAVQDLIERERARLANDIAQERACLANVIDRYHQISRIVLADPMLGPLGGDNPCPWTPMG